MYIDPQVVFLVAAVAASAFFGLEACTIFSVPWPSRWPGRIYQFWFNFCGSALGWGTLAVLYGRVGPHWSGATSTTFTLTDFGLALVAFAGVTGHIPMATMGIFRGLSDIAIAMFKRWFGDAD